MDVQKPKIKSKRLILQLKPSRQSLQTLILSLFMLALSIYSVQTATCPSSIPILPPTTTEQCSFSGYTNTYTRGVAVGPVSNSLYYLYYLSSSTSPYNAAVRKVDASGSQTWMASFAFYTNCEESVCRCSWAKCVSCKYDKSSDSAQTGSK